MTSQAKTFSVFSTILVLSLAVSFVGCRGGLEDRDSGTYQPVTEERPSNTGDSSFLPPALTGISSMEQKRSCGEAHRLVALCNQQRLVSHLQQFEVSGRMSSVATAESALGLDCHGHVPFGAKLSDGSPMPIGMKGSIDLLLNGADITTIAAAQYRGFIAAEAERYGWGEQRARTNALAGTCSDSLPLDSFGRVPFGAKLSDGSPMPIGMKGSIDLLLNGADITTIEPEKYRGLIAAEAERYGWTFKATNPSPQSGLRKSPSTTGGYSLQPDQEGCETAYNWDSYCRSIRSN